MESVAPCQEDTHKASMQYNLLIKFLLLMENGFNLMMLSPFIMCYTEGKPNPFIAFIEFLSFSFVLKFLMSFFQVITVLALIWFISYFHPPLSFSVIIYHVVMRNIFHTVLTLR